MPAGVVYMYIVIHPLQLAVFLSHCTFLFIYVYALRNLHVFVIRFYEAVLRLVALASIEKHCDLHDL